MLDDILTRRTKVSYAMKNSDEELIESLVGLIGPILDWDLKRELKEKQSYCKVWKCTHSWEPANEIPA